MNRKSRIIIVVATMVLTFGTLMATVGHKHFDFRSNTDGRIAHCESNQKMEGRSEKFSEEDRPSEHARKSKINQIQ